MNSILEISEAGNELETLKALRQKIAQTIDETKSARDIAALSRQLLLVTQRITDLEDYHSDSMIEDLIAKNADRVVRKAGTMWSAYDNEDGI